MSEWQKIETVPTCEVILYYPPVFQEHRGETHDAWMRIGYAGDTPFRPATHWMPLPKPPVMP